MPAALAGAPCARLALHAERLALEAETPGGPPLVVEAPLAPDLRALAEWLEARADTEGSGA